MGEKGGDEDRDTAVLAEPVCVCWDVGARKEAEVVAEVGSG